MITHIFRLIWNRKRSNILLTIELFVSFFVLFAIMTVGVYYADLYAQPLGFSPEQVWKIRIQFDLNLINADQTWIRNTKVTLRQLHQALRGFEEIESAAVASNPPFAGGHWQINGQHAGRPFETYVSFVNEDALDVLNLQITQGRWFDKTDEALNWTPVVINRRLSRELFGPIDPIGQRVGIDLGDDIRVIGVIEDFRQEGEFEGTSNYMFQPIDWNSPVTWPPGHLLIKVRADTTAAFEEKLLSRLRDLAKGWTFEVESLDRAREMTIGFHLAALTVAGIIAACLILMVGLGLVGVLWQTVTQRTREFGLRRSVGATAGDIRKQILGEVLAVTSVALALGAIVVFQFPLLDLVTNVSLKVYLFGLVLSIGLIGLFVSICALYPSWLATRAQPAEALHYE